MCEAGPLKPVLASVSLYASNFMFVLTMTFFKSLLRVIYYLLLLLIVMQYVTQLKLPVSPLVTLLSHYSVK